MRTLPLFFVIFLFLTTNFIYAQEFDSQRAFDDYLFNFNQYRQSHSQYVAAKEAYLSYKTLTSKDDAREKTLKMLQDEDIVISTYLTALRLKLADITGISNYEQNIVYLKLDHEVSWYQDHKNSLKTAATLEDLVNLAGKSKEQYKTTEVLSYQTLGTILAGKQTTYRHQLNEQINLLKEKIGGIRQKGDKQTTKAERWMLEAEKRLTKSQEKEFEAQQILVKMKSKDRNKNKTYNQARFLLEESHQYLKEASSQLQEVIKEIKSAD